MVALYFNNFTSYGDFASSSNKLENSRPMSSYSTLTLRSGITVVNEGFPRRGYCQLKTNPNAPRWQREKPLLCAIFAGLNGRFKDPIIASYLKLWVDTFALVNQQGGAWTIWTFHCDIRWPTRVTAREYNF